MFFVFCLIGSTCKTSTNVSVKVKCVWQYLLTDRVDKSDCSVLEAPSNNNNKDNSNEMYWWTHSLKLDFVYISLCNHRSSLQKNLETVDLHNIIAYTTRPTSECKNECNILFIISRGQKVDFWMTFDHSRCTHIHADTPTGHCLVYGKVRMRSHKPFQNQ